jgi:ubiquinone biosynthesis monooxygenase Coq7
LGDIRSDHAGESGAVHIYRGVLSASRDAGVRRLALHHLETERRHLALMEALLPAEKRSRLLPLWRAAGWVTGAVPALFGPVAVYRTIDAVETFVDRHYAEQIAKLQGHRTGAALRATLEACRLDEVAHRDDARSATSDAPGLLARCWTHAVTRGSRLGVALAKRY